MVIPAATVKPDGGRSRHRSDNPISSRLRRSAKVDEPQVLQSLRPDFDDGPQPFQRHFPVPRNVAGIGGNFCQFPWVDPLDEQTIERAGPDPAPGETPPRCPPPRPLRARSSMSRRSRGSIAAGTCSLSSINSRAPPMRSSSSGSPTGISRGSSSPVPLARTKASVTARTARLLGRRIRPRARPSGSLPKRLISPTANASAKDRLAGMVKTAGLTAARSGILERRFRHGDRFRRSDVEP